MPIEDPSLTHSDSMCSVVIVVPPFATTKYPMLGPSLLKAACRRRGISCKVLYANVWACSLIGFDSYEQIANGSRGRLFGEMLFSRDAFHRADQSALSPEDGIDCFPSMSRFFDLFDRSIRSIGPKIVGFSSTFQQTCAAISLARRVKDIAPGTITILGGANADIPMGGAIREVAGCFDFVFSGEADTAFPEFCENQLSPTPLASPPIVVCDPVAELDKTPEPDFGDYFDEADAQRLAKLATEELPVSMPFETSRGCWWGKRQHCTFCGLNARGMAHRRKTSGRILSELTSLIERYKPRRMHATDNIMPFDFPRSVLSMRKATEAWPEFFFEVKSNINTSHLDLFACHRINSIQPGIESLSTRLLTLMKKGVTGPQNIALLRNCASRQIDVNWNLLVAIPGDLRSDYDAMLAIFPQLEHLQPPTGCTPIVIDRYSPYFNLPQHFGITNLRPLKEYDLVYPLHIKVRDIAYHFRGDYESAYRGDAELALQLDNAVAKWRARWGSVDGQRPVLVAVSLEGNRAVVFDTRALATQFYTALDRDDWQTLKHFDRPRNKLHVPKNMKRTVRVLVRRGFLLEHENLLLNIVTEPELGYTLRAWNQPADVLSADRKDYAAAPGIADAPPP